MMVQWVLIENFPSSLTTYLKHIKTLQKSGEAISFQLGIVVYWQTCFQYDPCLTHSSTV